MTDIAHFNSLLDDTGLAPDEIVNSLGSAGWITSAAPWIAQLIQRYRNQVAQITGHAGQLEHCQSNLHKAEAQHQQDINVISDRLNHEAVERGWCAEYREVLEDLNRSLHRPLKGLAKSGRVELTYTVTVHATVENVSTEEDLDDLIENDYDPTRLGRMFDDYETEIDGGMVRYSVNYDHSRSRVVS